MYIYRGDCYSSLVLVLILVGVEDLAMGLPPIPRPNTGSVDKFPRVPSLPNPRFSPNVPISSNPFLPPPQLLPDQRFPPPGIYYFNPPGDGTPFWRNPAYSGGGVAASGGISGTAYVVSAAARVLEAMILVTAVVAVTVMCLETLSGF